MSMDYTAVAAPAPGYPVRLIASHPGRVSRLSTLFRIILVLPLLLFVGLLGGLGGLLPFPFGLLAFSGLLGAAAVVHWITVLVRGRPVGWLFHAIVAVQRFTFRAYSYLFLMTDRYPPLEGDWYINYEVDEPERIQRRQLVIWKTILSIPHFIVLTVVSLLVGVIVFISWFIILFTGEFPKGLYDFVAGWMRWSARVYAYWLSLTDVFPAYSLTEETGRGGQAGLAISAVIGGLIFFAGVGGVGAAIAVPADTAEVRVSYADLENGLGSDPARQAGVYVAIVEAADPYESDEEVLSAEARHRLVLFHIDLLNANNDQDVVIREGDFRLKDSTGEKHKPFLFSARGEPFGIKLSSWDDEEPPDEVDAHVIFEIPADSDPAELTYTPSNGFIGKERVKFIFEE